MILGSLIGGSIAAFLVWSLFPILTYAIFAVLVFVILIILLSYATTVYSMTNYRFEYQFGILGTSHQFIELSRISSIEVNRGFAGRIFSYGDIVIEGDSPLSNFTFRNIGDPEKYHRIIEEYTTHKRTK